MGRVFQPTYTYAGPNGERLHGKSKKWHIEYRDANGKVHHRVAGLTENQARDALRKQESMVLDQRNGIPTQRVSEILCADLADRYLASLENRVAPKTFQNLQSRIVTVLADMEAIYVRDLTPEAMEAEMARLADRHVARGRNNAGKTLLSTRSVNVHLQAMKQLLRWAVRARILPYSPIDCVQNLPAQTKYPRRPLEIDEIPRLLAAALAGPRRRAEKMYRSRAVARAGFKPATVPLPRQSELAHEGQRIFTIYSLLIGTGLRVNELKNLRWQDVDLELSVLRLSGLWTKNRKSDVLPLAPQLVDLLTDWKTQCDCAPEQPVVRMTTRLLKNFDDDLAAAGIEKIDRQGRVLCLHSLRHTFGQLLNAAGTDPKTLQTLMRHSSPILSLGIYVHRDKNREREAVAGLPMLSQCQSPLDAGPCVESTAKSS